MGGFIEMMGDFVDWVSKTYASLKSAVASKLVSVIPGCSSNPKCAGAIEMGLNAGIAELGMPPDLPDFDQLQAMGEGYLLDAVAQQVAAQTNLQCTDDPAKAALKEFIAQGKEAMQGGQRRIVSVDPRRFETVQTAVADACRVESVDNRRDPGDVPGRVRTRRIALQAANRHGAVARARAVRQGCRLAGAVTRTRRRG